MTDPLPTLLDCSTSSMYTTSRQLSLWSDRVASRDLRCCRRSTCKGIRSRCTPGRELHFLHEGERFQSDIVGLHSHPYLTTMTNEQIVAELGWTKKIIKDVTGVTPNVG